MQDSAFNPYQSPVELVTSSGRVSSRGTTNRLQRIAIASTCFLMGSIGLGLAIVWLLGAFVMATRQLGSVGPAFILMPAAYAAIIGSAFLTAGFKTINRKDNAAIESVVVAMIVLGLAFVSTVSQ